MYQIIYDFINEYLIGANTVNDIYAPQLAIILTHVTLVLFYIVLAMLIVWVFKFFFSLWSLK